MVEICDNGIDDDMDGLIDLEDDDCNCEPDWTYYINNPAFEDTVRCPCEVLGGVCIGLAASTEAASGWLGDNSWNGADYWHACFDYNLPGVGHSIPLPVPDGSGVMGFRANGPIGQPPNKEYIAQCLPHTLIQNVAYKIDFSIGFPDSVPDSVLVAIFGSDDCADWPLPYDGSNGGKLKPCPSTFSGWVALDSVWIRKQAGAWTISEMNFVPPKDINLIALGGSCNNIPFGGLGDYYFIDELKLTRQGLCNMDILISSPLCAGVAQLNITPQVGASYQWYKDSIALVGQTAFVYTIPRSDPDGTYQVMVKLPEGCFMSNPFDYSYTPIVYFDTVMVCEGDVYDFLGQELVNAGDYVDTVRTRENCDSILYLHLAHLKANSLDQAVTICDGDVHTIGSSRYTVSGTYMDTLTNAQNCDSIIRTLLTVLPKRYLDLDQTICAGEQYQVGTSTYNMSGTYTDTLVAINGCDSIIRLSLSVEEDFDTLITIILCPDEVITVNGVVYNTPGRYTEAFQSRFGCDSMITYLIQAATSPISLPDDYTIELGNSVFLSPDVNMAMIDSIWWDPNGDIDFDPQVIEQSIMPLTSTHLVLHAIDIGGCIWTVSVEINVRAIRTIYVPNAFTPNDDGSNDLFHPFLSRDVDQILFMQVYHRWGGLIYEDHHISLAEMGTDDRGWDGTNKGIVLPVGVYIYVIKVRFIDGYERVFKGDITLLR